MERPFLFYPLLALGLGWNSYKPELTMTTGQGLGPTLTSAEMSSPSELTNKLAVLSNTSIQLVGHVINVLFGLAITGLLARYLGVEGFGELSLALVYFSLIGILANWGFFTILVREISRLERWDEGIINAWISSGIFWSLVFTVGSATILLCILTVVDYAPGLKVRIFLMGLVHFTLILNVFDVLFRVKLKLGFSVLASVCNRLVHLSAVGVCVYYGSSLTWIVATYLLANFAGSYVLYLFSKRFLRFRFVWDPKKVAQLLRETAPLGLANAIYVLYYRIDALMIEGFLGLGALGIYNVAFRFLDYSNALAAMFLVPIYPLMANRFPTDTQGLIRMFQKTVDYAVIIGGIVSLGMIILAKPLVHLVFGDAYDASVIVLQVFGLSPVVIFFNRICGNMLIVLGMQGKALNTVLMSCLMLNIGLNLVLIPTFGYIGGAVTSLAVQCLALILNLWFINRKLQTTTYLTNVAVLFPALLLSLFAQQYLPGTVLKIIVPLCIVSSSALLFCRYDRRELLALASGIFRRT